MKRLVLTICMVFIASYAHGSFSVYYDKDTSEVQFISDTRVKLSSEDDVKLKKKKFSGAIKDYDLTEAYTDYKLIGGKFIVNVAKISDRVNADIADEEAAAARLVTLESVKVKLIELGLTSDEVDALIE